jgi:glycosyltransferase involved in cell wall biosynthesis
MVVDDGSSDALADSFLRWKVQRRPSFPVALLRQAHAGVSAARNRGLRGVPAATLVAFLDSDDQWPSDFLARIESRWAGQSAAVAVTSDLLVVDAWTEQTAPVATTSLASCPLRWFFQFGAGILSATVLRAESVRRLGAFELRLRTGQDAHLLLRLALLGPWLHAAGPPVRIGKHVAAAQGEYDHIARHFDVPGERWAEIYEEFLVEYRHHAELADPELSRLLAHRWYLAGHEWSRRGIPARARACYRRSLSVAPRTKTLRRLVREYFRWAS